MLSVIGCCARRDRRILCWLTGQTLAHADRLRVGGVEVVRREGVLRVEQWLLSLVFWGLRCC